MDRAVCGAGMDGAGVDGAGMDGAGVYGAVSSEAAFSVNGNAVALAAWRRRVQEASIAASKRACIRNKL